MNNIKWFSMQVGSRTGLWLNGLRTSTLKKGWKHRRVTPVDYPESGRGTSPLGSRRRRVTIVEASRRERTERGSTLGMSISSSDTGFSDDSFLSEF